MPRISATFKKQLVDICKFYMIENGGSFSEAVEVFTKQSAELWWNGLTKKRKSELQDLKKVIE